MALRKIVRSKILPFLLDLGPKLELKGTRYDITMSLTNLISEINRIHNQRDTEILKKNC